MTRSLADSVPSDASERVRYLPQNFIEMVCNEIGNVEGGEFDRQLKSVIYSHVSSADRLGQTTLDDLLKQSTYQTEEAVRLLLLDLSKMNEQLAVLQERSTPEYRAKLEAKRNLKVSELKAHDQTKPPLVPNPGEDDSVAATLKPALDSLDQKRRLLEQLEAEIATKQATLDASTLGLQKLRSVDAALDNLLSNFKLSLAEVSAAAAGLDLDVASLAKLEIDRSPVQAARSRTVALQSEAALRLGTDPVEGLLAKKSSIVTDIAALSEKLDGPQKAYQAYLTELANWSKARNQIVGSADVSESLAACEAELAELEGIPNQLKPQREARIGLVRRIFEEKERTVQTYQTIYSPLQKFANEHPVLGSEFKIQLTASIEDNAFREEFFKSFVRQDVAGSFAGIEEGTRRIAQLLATCDLNNIEGVLAFLDAVEDHLLHDKRDQANPSASLFRQLRKGTTLSQFYDFLFSIKYLQPRFSLTLGGKSLQQLSPGERGTLLLVFYLVVDKEDIPLVIDQPEENLDNQTVYSVLGACIREAKKRRQVIIVTHNPNLAVACDAEQIIYASHSANPINLISYLPGAIENPVINEKIIEVLEGTRPAFDSRESKYYRNWR